MPNLAGQMLPYLKGMGSSVLWGALKGAARGETALGRYLGTHAGRTIAGAGLGAAYGAYRGDNYSATSIMGGALMGAGLGRYGGMMMKSGMTAGIGLRGAARRTVGLAMADGRAASRFIGRNAISANNGFNKIRGLPSRIMHEFSRFTG